MKYMIECLDENFYYLIRQNKIIFEGKSKYQKIEIFENKKFGKILRLDKSFQTSEKDEYMYHEPLVHVPLITHPKPEKVLIIGGGDGGSLKQVLKHKNIRKIDMVELDVEVINASKKYLKKIHENSFENKKANIIIDDGIEFLKKTKEKYDVIILDLTDPGSISLFLYTNKFYDLVKSKLNKNGIVSLHTETPYMVDEVHVKIIKTLMKSFKIVRPFYNYVMTYGTIMGFAFCSNKYDAKKINVKEVDKRIEKRKIKKLKMFNGESFCSMLVVPKYVKEGIQNRKIKIITEKTKIKDYDELDKVTLKIENLFSKSNPVSIKEDELTIK